MLLGRAHFLCQPKPCTCKKGSSKYHWHIIEISSTYHGNLIEISSKSHRTIIAISSKYHRNIIKHIVLVGLLFSQPWVNRSIVGFSSFRQALWNGANVQTNILFRQALWNGAIVQMKNTFVGTKKHEHVSKISRVLIRGLNGLQPALRVGFSRFTLNGPHVWREWQANFRQQQQNLVFSMHICMLSKSALFTQEVGNK